MMMETLALAVMNRTRTMHVVHGNQNFNILKSAEMRQHQLMPTLEDEGDSNGTEDSRLEYGTSIY
jgi:hypothetical protein